MTPVFFIEGKVCPYVEHVSFVYPIYDEVEVGDNGLIVSV